MLRTLLALVVGTAAISSGAPVITPAKAKVVVASYTTANDKSNAALSIALQNELERDSAAAIDDAYFRIARATGLKASGPFTAVGLKVYAPRQTGYPAVFVAVAHIKNKGKTASKDTAIWLFQRSSAKDSWRFSSGVVVPAGQPVPVLKNGADGYLPALDLTTLSQTRAGLTAAWLKAQRTAAAGKLPGTPWTKTAQLSQYVSTAASRGELTEHDTFAATKWAPVCVAAVGGALCFTSTSWTAKLTLTAAQVASGARLTIDSAALQLQFGGVAQGSYKAITVVDQRQNAIVVPTKGAKGGLRVLASAYGPISGKASR